MVGVALGVVAFAMAMLPEHFKVAMHTTGGLHMWFHLALFAVLGGLAWLSSDKGSTRLVLLVAAILLGMGMEASEAGRYHETVEGYDIRTDTCGVVLGALSAWGLLQTLHRDRP